MEPESFRPWRLLRPILLAGTLLHLGVGCAPYGPYFGPQKHPFAANRQAIVQEGGYARAVVEFGERGSLQVPRQQEDLVRLIAGKSEAEKARPVFLVTFIHGWHNSAVSGNLDSFDKLLGKLARSPSLGKFRVVGAYLAWRGDTVTLEGAKYLSYWNRRDVAAEIAGGNDMLATLLVASQAAKQGKGFVVVMGHSFGGLIVERALNHTLLGAVTEPPDPGSPAKKNVLPWDLAVTLNQATNSIRTRQILSTLSQLYRYEGNGDGKGRYVALGGGTDLPEAQPLVIALTSATDLATKTALPVGQVAEQAATLFRAYDRVEAPYWDQRRNANVALSEAELHRQAPGHSDFITTHDVRAVKGPPSSSPAPANDAFEANLAPSGGGLRFWIQPKAEPPTTPLRQWEFTHRPAADRGGARLPYWVVRVDPEIIKDHGDIWNDRCAAMLAALYRMSHPLPAAQANRTALPTETKRKVVPSLLRAIQARRPAGPDR